MVSGKWHTLKIEVDVNKRVVAHFNGKRMGSFAAFSANPNLCNKGK